MGEPATEIDTMDSAKDSRGLDLGLKKAMASDLDGLRRKQYIVQEPVVNPLSARFYRSDLICERRQVSTDIQLSVISILMEGHNYYFIR